MQTTSRCRGARMVLVTGALGLLWAGPVAGQACLGFPQGSTGAVGATFSFPEGGTGYALDGMVASDGGGAFFQGGFGILSPDNDLFENTKIVQGTAAYEVEALAPDVSVCPGVGLAYSWVGALNTWTIPFGVAAGGTVPLGRGGGGGFTPWAVPQFLYVRASIDDVEDSADSDVFVGLVAGLTVNVDALRVTGAMNKVFEEGVDAVFSLSVGAVW